MRLELYNIYSSILLHQSSGLIDVFSHTDGLVRSWVEFQTSLGLTPTIDVTAAVNVAFAEHAVLGMMHYLFLGIETFR